MRRSPKTERDHRPAYIRIAESLKSRILSGRYEDRITGELALAKEFEVSRRTIQQALEQLAGEGYILRKHGSGTFVNKARVEKQYRSIVSISEGIAQQGLEQESRILFSGLVSPPPEASAFFDDAAIDQVYEHTRLIMSEGTVLAYASAYLNASKLPDLDLTDLNGSLYARLRKQYGRTVVFTEDQYIPQIPEPSIAKYLNLPTNSPVLTVLRTATDQTGYRIEFSCVHLLPVPLNITIMHSSVVDSVPQGGEWHYNLRLGSFFPSAQTSESR